MRIFEKSVKLRISMLFYQPVCLRILRNLLLLISIHILFIHTYIIQSLFLVITGLVEITPICSLYGTSGIKDLLSCVN